MPYPANYGGVIDVYYKIKAFHEQGIKVHLHCFEYGRSEAKELNNICEQVHYYERKLSKQKLFNSLPFVVATRTSEQLIDNLLKDNYPILFEGLHCCYHLQDKRLKDRIKIVRTHNIEHDYYKNLEKVEKKIFKKLYFRMEAKKLERFEKTLKYATHIAAISPADKKELSKRYNNVYHITAFHPHNEVNIKEGIGNFCLYHGNLEVGENNEAALYLVNEVFSKIKTPLIIAGKKPSNDLVDAVAKHKHIVLKANINTSEIDDLIADAQINVLPTFQATGIKLKLLAALFKGRHCIVNTPMVENTGMEQLCSIKNNAQEMCMAISELYTQPIDAHTLKHRKIVLHELFSNDVNIKKIIALTQQEKYSVVDNVK